MGGRECDFTERKDLVTSLSKETWRIVTSLQRYLDIMMMLFENVDLGILDVSLEHHDHAYWTASPAWLLICLYVFPSLYLWHVRTFSRLRKTPGCMNRHACPSE